MSYGERSNGESSGRHKATAVAVAGVLALTLAGCTSSTSSAQQPTHRAVVTAPPAEGCIGITAAEVGAPSPEGTEFSFQLIGHWGAGTKPVGEQLTITPESSAGPGTPEIQPEVPVRTDGSLPDRLSYVFPAAEVAATYAVQGTIILRHGAHRLAPVTPFCATEVTVQSTPYQDAPYGSVTVSNNN